MRNDNIKKRLYSIIPVGTLQMQEFLSLLNIRLTKAETKTACVTCSYKPELIINSDFIDEHCKSDEHLFMLVMHELYHIILGHTTLFNRTSIIDNIAFDAVINAMLCRMFPSEEYVSFFKQINSSKSFPSCLLRPKAEDTPKEMIPLLDLLYESNTGTYFDTYQSIIKYLKNNGQLHIFQLLGNHDSNNSIDNPILNKIIEKMVEKWPRPPKIINGRDLGGSVKKEKIIYQFSNKEKRKMIHFLRKANIEFGNTERNVRNNELIKTDITTFVPNYKDRTITAKKVLIGNCLQYKNDVYLNNFVNSSKCKTFVYLDVSGSVLESLKKFIPLLIKPYKNKECIIYTFSTEVIKTTPNEIIEGKVNTTGGTDINCIFEHLYSLKKNHIPKKIIIFTDGETGSCSSYYQELINKYRTKIYVGLFGDRTTKEYLENIAKEFEEFNL